ncbi:MAG: Uma2 family endonuclease [Pirellulaceae bacterium]
MSVGLHITYEDYLHMIEAGAFDTMREKRIELIHGELREMAPPGPSHSELVSRLTHWSVLKPPPDRVKVRIQDPIGIPELDSGPQPDIVWAQPKSYDDHHPLPDEVLLVIEVADSSLAFDCGAKANLYAAGGIADYWVVDVQQRTVHLFRQPGKRGYGQRLTYKEGQQLSPLAFPQVAIDLSELFR